MSNVPESSTEDEVLVSVRVRMMLKTKTRRVLIAHSQAENRRLNENVAWIVEQYFWGQGERKVTHGR